METITSVFEQAELAEAAYANFIDGSGNLIIDKDKIITALRDYSFSAVQASDFLTHWKIIDQCPNTDTGFSGTVFERLDGPNAGERYISICGTEGSKLLDGSGEGKKDIAEDIANIGADGIAINQAIDMYNWYLRLISPQGDVKQYYYHKKETNILNQITKPAWIEEKTITTIENGALYGEDKPDTVVGHSLGGHLAMIMSRLFSDISSVTTFNAPGFDTKLGVDIWGVYIVPSVNALTSDGFFDLLRGKSGSDEIGSTWTATMNNFRIPWDVVSRSVQSRKVRQIFFQRQPTRIHIVHISCRQ